MKLLLALVLILVLLSDGSEFGPFQITPQFVEPELMQIEPTPPREPDGMMAQDVEPEVMHEVGP